ncbi:MAG TPA: hypothetical protein VFA43_09290 [Gemmatimonadaceae bacterium]|nr:hypothetical protein [Gemmatimonadaceae bacterium]
MRALLVLAGAAVLGCADSATAPSASRLQAERFARDAQVRPLTGSGICQSSRMQIDPCDPNNPITDSVTLHSTGNYPFDIHNITSGPITVSVFYKCTGSVTCTQSNTLHTIAAGGFYNFQVPWTASTTGSGTIFAMAGVGEVSTTIDFTVH